MSDSRKSETKHVSVPCVHCGETEFRILLREDTFHRYVCPKCKTPTYIYITQKLEIILLREEELCPECHGTGKCSKCNGTGQVKCPKCDGYGFYEGSIDYYGCELCGGYGIVSHVSQINQSKYIKRGSGLVRCDSCNGTGICPTCGGYRGVWGRRNSR